MPRGADLQAFKLQNHGDCDCLSLDTQSCRQIRPIFACLTTYCIAEVVNTLQQAGDQQRLEIGGFAITYCAFDGRPSLVQFKY
jgi:hypothetical protein